MEPKAFLYRSFYYLLMLHYTFSTKAGGMFGVFPVFGPE